MAVNLHGRSLLSLVEETPAEIRYLVDLAHDLKRAKYARQERQMLVGRSIALIFEKTSTRTRSAFEVAAADQGASTTFLEPSSTQIGHKESQKDTARVLGRMFDAIQYRGDSQETVERLAQWAGVPVYNGLTDDWHPTQMLADALTMAEHTHKHRHETSFAYLGDARNNMGHSLLLLGAKLGMDVRIGAPEALQPAPEVVQLCQRFADESGARLTITDDPVEAVRGVDFVHTDVWVSMGEPKEAWDERIDLLLPYQVNAALMAATENPRVRFMHCLPAYHDAHTTVGAELIGRRPELASGVEVTDEVFESAASIVFDQAENRLHTIKALMVATLV
ncbi:ornithine carbamoyltransferase [Ornithinimicrobium tianjinense]|uniref:Ornithine carbamoyltransferase n=1 Tax=Ornithinimicrobium tianjinense TaxID=1195761 RepID=A0A917BGC1_9MICO|nr:ornithine carbamoyltransferase [Ornithinimicrobium tianjinense]GGF38582.1 ornithine carbamoyltransferase, catabolic [Ornithinimicrobium tianjinense]